MNRYELWSPKRGPTHAHASTGVRCLKCLLFFWVYRPNSHPHSFLSSSFVFSFFAPFLSRTWSNERSLPVKNPRIGIDWVRFAVSPDLFDLYRSMVGVFHSSGFRISRSNSVISFLCSSSFLDHLCIGFSFEFNTNSFKSHKSNENTWISSSLCTFSWDVRDYLMYECTIFDSRLGFDRSGEKRI